MSNKLSVSYCCSAPSSTPKNSFILCLKIFPHFSSDVKQHISAPDDTTLRTITVRDTTFILCYTTINRLERGDFNGVGTWTGAVSVLHMCVLSKPSVCLSKRASLCWHDETAMLESEKVHIRWISSALAGCFVGWWILPASKATRLLGTNFWHGSCCLIEIFN